MMQKLCQKVKSQFLKMCAVYSGVENGDRVTFIVEGNTVRVVNSAVYALKRLQEQMAGEGEKVGLLSEEDVANWITQSRREENAE